MTLLSKCYEDFALRAGDVYNTLEGEQLLIVQKDAFNSQKEFETALDIIAESGLYAFVGFNQERDVCEFLIDGKETS